MKGMPTHRRLPFSQILPRAKSGFTSNKSERGPVTDLGIRSVSGLPVVQTYNAIPRWNDERMHSHREVVTLKVCISVALFMSVDGVNRFSVNGISVSTVTFTSDVLNWPSSEITDRAAECP